MATIYTIGHSTRDLAEFSRVLQEHEIRLLEDIRAFPMSRRFPHFNREHLELWLPEIGCDYVWEKDLGGRRNKQMSRKESPNVALRNDSFRNYADYMLSVAFQNAAARLKRQRVWAARRLQRELRSLERPGRGSRKRRAPGRLPAGTRPRPPWRSPYRGADPRARTCSDCRPPR